jgi:hypothetical protein
MGLVLNPGTAARLLEVRENLKLHLCELKRIALSGDVRDDVRIFCLVSHVGRMLEQVKLWEHFLPYGDCNVVVEKASEDFSLWLADMNTKLQSLQVRPPAEEETTIQKRRESAADNNGSDEDGSFDCSEDEEGFGSDDDADQREETINRRRHRRKGKAKASVAKKIRDQMKMLVKVEQAMLKEAWQRIGRADDPLVAMDTNVHQLVAHRMQQLVIDSNHSFDEVGQIIADFFQAIQGNFNMEDVISRVNDVENHNVRAYAVRKVNGEESMFHLCAKMEGAATSELKELPPKVIRSKELLEAELWRLDDAKGCQRRKSDLKSLLRYLRGDPNGRKKSGSSFIVNLCHIKICIVVMKNVTLRFLFQQFGDTERRQRLSELYQLILHEDYDAAKVTAFQMMDKVFPEAFTHPDSNIRRNAITAFEDIQARLRSAEVFKSCEDNGTQFESIDGKHKSNSGFECYVATDEAGRRLRKLVVNTGTAMFLAPSLLQQIPSSPEISHDRLLLGMLTSPTRWFERKMATLFDDTGKLQPAARDYFTQIMQVNEHELEKTIVFEQPEQLQAYMQAVAINLN